MKTTIFITCSLILLLSACSGNSLAPKNNNEISVHSEPSGASVYVMGKLVGTTPTVVDVDLVYPVTYSQENKQHYGHINLTHEGCNDQTIKISARMISNGLKASLDCQVNQEQEVDTQPLADKSVKQRLQELQALKNDGLINEQEYQEIRIRILKSI